MKKAKTKVSSKPQLRMISVTLYDDDIRVLDGLVAQLKNRGFSAANRSALLRALIDVADIDRVVGHDARISRQTVTHDPA